MWDLIIFLGCVGWFLAGVVLIALLAQSGARREREKREAAKLNNRHRK